jgi:hypothetical protein
VGLLLPVRIESKLGNDPVRIATFKYNGNKLESSTDGLGQKIVYKYEGNSITSKTYFVGNEKLATQKISYSSDGNPLKSVLDVRGGINNNYVETTTYDFSKSDKVTIRTIIVPQGGKADRQTITEFISNGNIVKSIFNSDFLKNTTTFEYDNKKSPFINVIGNRRFIDTGLESLSINNVVRDYSNDDGSASYKYKYNNNGFPTRSDRKGVDLEPFFVKYFYN